MELSLDAVRQIEFDLLNKTDVLAHYLSAYGARDEEGATRVLNEMVERLHRALSVQTGPNADRSSRADGSSPFAWRIDPIEEFILDSLADSARGLSVQEIVERFDEAKIDMKRPTLVVRLHRLVRAGKLASRAHGLYALSEEEFGRRRASNEDEQSRRQSA